MMNFNAWLTAACARLMASDSDSAKRDAEILLAQVTGRSRSYVLAFGETLLSIEQQFQLEQLLVRRQHGEPIAYLIGEREFWSLPLSVSPATMIPRPDTECLVEQALLRLGPAPTCLLDLGTGTGAIALALASERPDCTLIGVDLQAEAVKLAQLNARKLSITNVIFLTGSWFMPLDDRRFSLIVSNPPYIDASDPHLSQGDLRFEPASALVAERHGLADIEHIASGSSGYLLPEGWLLLEHGWQQAEAVRKILQSAGFVQIETIKDHGDNDRVTLGQWLDHG